MIPGDFQPRKPSGRDLLKLSVLGGGSLLGLIVVGFLLVFVISAWLGRPVVFGYNEGPDQPIAFPHSTHVEELGLDCTFCHRNVAKEAAATIPATGLCLSCHQVVGDGLPEVEKLRATVESQGSIDWVRVHRVPDHVRFVHEAHIRFFTQRDGVEAQAVCSTCHGDVSATPKIRMNRDLKMGDCVDCHRENNAPTDCTTCHF